MVKHNLSKPSKTTKVFKFINENSRKGLSGLNQHAGVAKLHNVSVLCKLYLYPVSQLKQLTSYKLN